VNAGKGDGLPPRQIDIFSLKFIFLPVSTCWTLPLKVDGNEKLGGWGLGKNTVIQVLSGIVAIEGFLQFERAVSL
jgi:hypothetical protein